MRINNLYNCQIKKRNAIQIPNQNKLDTDKISFNGLHRAEDKSLFVFDLDGSLAEGSSEDTQEILKLQKKSNATLVYATGRTLEEFYQLQDELKNSGTNLPTPEHLVTCDGQFIYNNIDGKLVEDLNWKTLIQNESEFDKAKIYKIINSIAHTPEYKLDKNELKHLQKHREFKEIKEMDPDFWDSQIACNKYGSPKHILEFIIPSNVDINRFQEKIQNELGKDKIKPKILINEYSKDIKGLLIFPAEKADGVNYLRKELGIPFNEILSAGNDINDISLANLTRKGSFFICIKESSRGLKTHVEKLKNKLLNPFHTNLISPKSKSVEGIIEGINKILSGNFIK